MATTKAKKGGWKQKKLYKITAPTSFDQQEIGGTMASNESSLIGRTIEMSLKDLTGDKGQFRQWNQQLINAVMTIDESYSKITRDIGKLMDIGTKIDDTIDERLKRVMMWQVSAGTSIAY